MRWLPILCLLSLGCDPAVHATGRVHAPSGAPIAEAQVALQVGRQMPVELAWTDSLGRFAVTRFGSTEPPFELRVCRDGYQTVARTFQTLDALADSLDFVLVPSESTTPGGGRGPRCGQPFRPAA